MCRSVLLAIAALLATEAAHAATLNPKLDDVCTPTPMAPSSRGQVDPRKFLGLLLKTHGIHDLDLDTTGNDVLFAKKVTAVTQFNTFCGAEQVFRRGAGQA
jgi:hypothetical protein